MLLQFLASDLKVAPQSVEEDEFDFNLSVSRSCYERYQTVCKRDGCEQMFQYLLAKLVFFY